MPIKDKTDEILKQYGLKRDTARRYVEAIVAGNQKETAEEIGVSQRTISNYKTGFKAMDKGEKAVVLYNLMKENYDETVEELLAES